LCDINEPYAFPGDDFTGQDGFVSGWGDAFLSNDTDAFFLDNLESPDILQASKKFRIQNQTYCTRRDLELQYLSTTEHEIIKHKKYLSVFNSTLCTLSRGEDEDKLVHVGNGDSGGPLVIFNNVTDGIELPILVGVVSYGISDEDSAKPCSSRKDHVNNTIEYFTSVPFFREWIDLTVASFDNPHERKSHYSS